MLKEVGWLRKQYLWTFYQIALRQAKEDGQPNWIASYFALSMIVFTPGIIGLVVFVDEIVLGGVVRTTLTKFEFFQYRGSVNAFVVLFGFIPGLVLGYFACFYKIEKSKFASEFKPLSGKAEWLKLSLMFFSGVILAAISSTVALNI